MQLARGILAGLILLGLSGLVQAQSLTDGSSRVVTANSQRSNEGGKSRPNILFIIMDDVGIDQMSIFGYGGGTAPLTPNYEQVMGVDRTTLSARRKRPSPLFYAFSLGLIAFSATILLAEEHSVQPAAIKSANVVQSASCEAGVGAAKRQAPSCCICRARAGASYRPSPAPSGMVWIPGEFWMGSDAVPVGSRAIRK
jgi:hypothetical protein